MKNDNFEELKQKLVVYKQTLETMKSGNVVEDYLMMKNECYNLIKQVSQLENNMETVKNNHDDEITNITQQVDMLAKKVKSIDLSIEQVKQDVKTLTDKVNSLNLGKLILKMEKLLGNGDSLAMFIEEEKKGLEVLKDELIELKSDLLETKGVMKSQIANTVAHIKPTSYQQLRQIIQSSTSSPEILPETREPFRKDISNFYQSVSKNTHKANFLPPVIPKPQKIELIDQINESNSNLEELKEVIPNDAQIEEEKPVIVSENRKIPLSNEPSNL